MVTLAIHQRSTKARQRYTSQRAEGKVRDEKWEGRNCWQCALLSRLVEGADDDITPKLSFASRRKCTNPSRGSKWLDLDAALVTIYDTLSG